MTEKIETGCVSGTCFNGFGKRVYENGDWYEGEWKNAKRHGKGFFHFAEGFYDGEWKENKRHGQGTLTKPNGEKYVGKFKDNMFSGKGTYTFPNGDKYEGEFKNGKLHGKNKA